VENEMIGDCIKHRPSPKEKDKRMRPLMNKEQKKKMEDKIFINVIKHRPFVLSEVEGQEKARLTGRAGKEG
jgi:hypothetical protein